MQVAPEVYDRADQIHAQQRAARGPVTPVAPAQAPKRSFLRLKRK